MFGLEIGNRDLDVFDQAHVIDEYVEIKQIDLYLMCLLKLCKRNESKGTGTPLPVLLFRSTEMTCQEEAYATSLSFPFPLS